MRIRWSPEAADDLEGIVPYIRQDKPDAPAETRGKERSVMPTAH